MSTQTFIAGSCDPRNMQTGNRLTMAIFLLMLALTLSLVSGSPPLLAAEKQQAVASQSAPAKVNINTADAQALAASLKGVGDSRAQDIVRYRETYGPFASAEELMEVKGIGQSTLDRNRDLITLE